MPAGGSDQRKRRGGAPVPVVLPAAPGRPTASGRSGTIRGRRPPGVERRCFTSSCASAAGRGRDGPLLISVSRGEKSIRTERFKAPPRTRPDQGHRSAPHRGADRRQFLRDPVSPGAKRPRRGARAPWWQAPDGRNAIPGPRGSRAPWPGGPSRHSSMPSTTAGRPRLRPNATIAVTISSPSARDEATVDLDAAEKQDAQVGQARVAGAEIVHRQPCLTLARRLSLSR